MGMISGCGKRPVAALRCRQGEPPLPSPADSREPVGFRAGLAFAVQRL